MFFLLHQLFARLNLCSFALKSLAPQNGVGQWGAQYLYRGGSSATAGSSQEWGIPVATSCTVLLEAVIGSSKNLSPRVSQKLVGFGSQESQNCSELLPVFHSINNISGFCLTSKLPMVATVVTNCSFRYPWDAAATDRQQEEQTQGPFPLGVQSPILHVSAQ